jgi:hypothetical protein
MRQPLTNSTPRTEMPTHGAILLAAAFPATAQRRGPLPAQILSAAAWQAIAQCQVLLPEPTQRLGPAVPVLVVQSPLHHHHATADETENTLPHIVRNNVTHGEILEVVALQGHRLRAHIVNHHRPHA